LIRPAASGALAAQRYPFASPMFGPDGPTVWPRVSRVAHCVNKPLSVASNSGKEDEVFRRKRSPVQPTIDLVALLEPYKVTAGDRSDAPVPSPAEELAHVGPFDR
jgi:hypothetical protein